MKSYFTAFSDNPTLGTEGLLFIILSIIILGFQLVIANRKAYHEALSFIMSLQVIGLLRAS
jgi:thiosulfate reductase cytochrome b subunit